MYKKRADTLNGVIIREDNCKTGLIIKIDMGCRL